MAKFSSDTDCQFLHQNSRLGKFRLNLPVHFCALPGDGADVPRGPFPGGPVRVLGKCSPYPAATDFYGTEATAAMVCKGLNVGVLADVRRNLPILFVYGISDFVDRFCAFV